MRGGGASRSNRDGCEGEGEWVCVVLCVRVRVSGWGYVCEGEGEWVGVVLCVSVWVR